MSKMKEGYGMAIFCCIIMGGLIIAMISVAAYYHIQRDDTSKNINIEVEVIKKEITISKSGWDEYTRYNIIANNYEYGDIVFIVSSSEYILYERGDKVILTICPDRRENRGGYIYINNWGWAGLVNIKRSY